MTEDKSKLEELEDKNEDEDDHDPEVFEVFTQKHVVQVHDIYLGESIHSSTKYYKLFTQLKRASKNDTFNFILNNYGGSCHAGTQLILNVRETAANVKMIVEGPIYSMASLIALSVRDVVFKPHTFIMFHDYSTITGGKGSEILQGIKMDQFYFKNVLEDVCKGFLTKGEIKRMMKGEDFYIGHDEANARIKRRNSKHKHVK